MVTVFKSMGTATRVKAVSRLSAILTCLHSHLSALDWLANNISTLKGYNLGKTITLNIATDEDKKETTKWSIKAGVGLKDAIGTAKKKVEEFMEEVKKMDDIQYFDREDNLKNQLIVSPKTARAEAG